jgi:hypothetical protein
MIRSLIVQPWFSVTGHPAQSTLNSARIIGAGEAVGYLISDPRGGPLEPMAVELCRYGPVARFGVPGSSLRLGTLLSFPAIMRFGRNYPELERILFLDGYLLAIAAVWPVVRRFLPSVRALAVLCVGGPERFASFAPARALVARFMSVTGGRIFLRTEELARAWRAVFPGVAPGQIDTIPSLEIPDTDTAVPPRDFDGHLRFGVIGQIRPGKSLEWLVPLFTANPELGTLRVAGTFSIPEHRGRLAVLDGYSNFDDRFLTEAEMLAAASEQDYLVALYDNWDSRMEVATVYLAARVGRPVIVYSEGWPGRIVNEFGCGVAVPKSPRPDKEFFSSLRRQDDKSYRALLAGMERFRNAHAGASARDRFLAKLGNE